MLVLLFFIALPQSNCWLEDINAHTIYDKNVPETLSFQGNKDYNEYFKLVEQNGVSLLLGGRNVVYNISLKTLLENNKILLNSIKSTTDSCLEKGKSMDDCQNYIRVLIKISENSLLVCGTNAYNPVCQVLELKNGVYVIKSTIDGIGVCPFDRNQNNTVAYFDKKLYTGTSVDYTGSNSGILKLQLPTASKPKTFVFSLQTESYNPLYVNEPNFVNSFKHKEYVYIFFREIAMEHSPGRATFSRVARVCENDMGGQNINQKVWTSLLKARLNCSVAGDFPFYFNELQSTSELIDGIYGNAQTKLIYAVFNTPLNSISGSAVCAFSIDDITKSFNGQFQGQESNTAKWLPVANSDVQKLNQRPGKCVNNSRSLLDANILFINEKQLMNENVPPYWGQPIIIKTCSNYRLTQIAVDHQIMARNGKPYDVLFIGTDNGKIIKVINKGTSKHKVETIVIEEIQIFPENTPVINLKVYKFDHSKVLIALSQNELKSLPLYRCKEQMKCGQCVALQDPYCAWNKLTGNCVNLETKDLNDSNFIQSIEHGKYKNCPGELDTSGKQRTSNLKHSSSSLTSKGSGYNVMSLSVSVVVSLIKRSFMGFLVGYLY